MRLPIYTRVNGREHNLGVIEVPLNVVLEPDPLVPPREHFLVEQAGGSQTGVKSVDIPGEL